ncbi:MAG: prephenate dehydrogenase/arogenate dehydrogenase family protein [Clostridia bacterium]|nr:prephenate dehydrogenase/arogenate dehydrogenase family protein [Clostridia bacterium]
MKKIAIIGLGIIGGSICAALTKAGYAVDGADIDETVVGYALGKGYIRGKAEDISVYDVVFVAAPPRATINILDSYSFKNGAIVCDICGVKQEMERVVYSRARNYRYVGLHPMAGKETSGIASASADLFAMANLVIVLAEHTDEEALNEVKSYAKAMRFGKIVECSAEEHDKKIALTSQLAHVVSNAYVKSPQVADCDGFTGGSFQDMTRIAGVDEDMWTELYFHNRAYLLTELDGLITNLEKYKSALINEDENAFKDALKEGRLIREKIKFKKK